MLRAIVYGSLFLSLIPLPAMAAPKEPQVLASTIKWEINYDKEACHLLNKFGTGDDEVTLRMTRYRPGDQFDISLYGPRFKSDTTYVQTEVSFDPNPPQKRLALAATVGKKLPLLLLGGLHLIHDIQDKDAKTKIAAVTPEQEGKVTGITLKLKRKQPIFLKTGSLAGPLRAMRKCTDDLIQSWGYEPAQFARIKDGPVPLSSLETWLKGSDYPFLALVQNESGEVQFRLEVNPDGSVGNCHILYRTSPDQFADHTCKLLRERAKFLPAVDITGMPTRWYYINKVRWLIEPSS